MGVALGLSLTSDEVVWVLVDDCGQTLLDHDARSVAPAPAAVVAAARSARSLAAVDGIALDAVRLTGIGGVSDEVVAGLRSAGFELEIVDLADAVAAAAVFPPGLRAAAGAALHRSERDCAPVPAVLAPTRRRRGVLATLIGTAAAAVLGVLFLATGSVPQDAQASTVEPVTATDSGWVSVPVTPLHAPMVTRKIVTTTAATVMAPRTVSESTERVYTAVRPAPAPASQPVSPQPVAEQHLTDPVPLAGPMPADPTATAVPLPGSDVVMTDLSNMFTALP
ncbi:hypothetical protein ACQI4F_06105 [Mycolicibacterium vaccae]|uniref:hypothetical protein n=1 Tax=Mycolicibacterium vaccae TaxID=1810 RepID=UPI003CECE9DC